MPGEMRNGPTVGAILECPLLWQMWRKRMVHAPFVTRCQCSGQYRALEEANQRFEEGKPWQWRENSCPKT